MQIFSLLDLYQHLRRVVALNFFEPVWITAEIAQLSLSRGHIFLDLVQKGDEDVVAHGQAVIWARDYQRLRRRVGPALDEVLREGMEVKMRVRVDFHERYGLKLLPEDVDTAYTFGQLEILRRESIQTLRDLGLFERNQALELPPVLQRIAVISSEGAAGFQDFRGQLATNIYGYNFDCQLFSSAVQGTNAAPELLAALNAVRKKAGHFDCVVVLRGGGARLDLAAFDGFEVCRAAAELPLPLFTGIGHDSDQTVLDLVAHTSLKTPTAVADHLIQHNFLFENNLLRLAGQLHLNGKNRVNISTLELEKTDQAVQWSGRERLRSADQHLQYVQQNLPLLAHNLLRAKEQHLVQAEAVCLALHPDSILRRGFSLTLKNGKAVTSPDQVKPGETLETRVKGGVIFSTTE